MKNLPRDTEPTQFNPNKIIRSVTEQEISALAERVAERRCSAPLLSVNAWLTVSQKP